MIAVSFGSLIPRTRQTIISLSINAMADGCVLDAVQLQQSDKTIEPIRQLAREHESGIGVCSVMAKIVDRPTVALAKGDAYDISERIIGYREQPRWDEAFFQKVVAGLNRARRYSFITFGIKREEPAYGRGVLGSCRLIEEVKDELVIGNASILHHDECFVILGKSISQTLLDRIEIGSG